jgi:hypothetical protein
MVNIIQINQKQIGVQSLSLFISIVQYCPDLFKMKQSILYMTCLLIASCINFVQANCPSIEKLYREIGCSPIQESNSACADG